MKSTLPCYPSPWEEKTDRPFITEHFLEEKRFKVKRASKGD